MTDGIFLSQAKYTREMLKKFEMDDCKPVGTPIPTSCKLSKEENSPCIDQKLYRSMIGSLLYLTATRPDILYAVCLAARYQADPREAHLQAVKRIFRYLKGTEGHGLFYKRNSSLTLYAYSDADWAGCVDDRKSTSGGAFYLGDNLVSWHSKKQESVSLSTAEAEYIAATSSCTQVLYMVELLRNFGVDSLKPVVILCDNSSAINISKNPVQHSRTKHIEIRYHFLKDKVSQGEIKLEYVPTKDQVADIFTKPLPKEQVDYLCSKMGLQSLASLQGVQETGGATSNQA